MSDGTEGTATETARHGPDFEQEVAEETENGDGKAPESEQEVTPKELRV